MSDPILEALWKRVLDAWDDERTHGTFLQHCAETGQLGEAAARYKGMAGDRDRGAIANKRLEAVALLATQTMLAARTEPSSTLPRWLLFAAAFLFAALAGWFAMRTMPVLAP